MHAAFEQLPVGADVEELAEGLRRAFPEYKRQKAGPFRQQVDRALSLLRAQGHLAAAPSVRASS